MRLSRRSNAFYALLISGLTFILVGSMSAVYTSISVEVPIDNKIEPSKNDMLTPDMTIGNTANITVSGSSTNITIADPDREIILLKNNVSNFHYKLVAQKDGEYTISIKNIGNSQLQLSGSAYTRGNPIAFSGEMMLIVTGVIVTGLGLRIRKR